MFDRSSWRLGGSKRRVSKGGDNHAVCEERSIINDIFL